MDDVLAGLPTTTFPVIPETAWIGGQAPPLPRAEAPMGDTPRLRLGDPDHPVLERLHGVVRAIPDHIAVDDGTTRLSYRQLWRLIGALSRAVIAATPDHSTAPVAILLADDCFYAAAYFVGLATGRPVVPLNRQVPAARNADILRDSGAGAIVLRAADRDDRMLPTSIVVVTLETALLEAGDAGVTLPGPGLPADRPAFILYTSGSTGKPKGIAVSQHGWSRLMWLRAVNMNWAAGDHALRLGPMATAWGINATGGLLLAGAAVHIMDLLRLGFGALLGLIARRGITQLHAGPSLMKALARTPDAAAALAGVKLVALGGELVLRADVAEIRAVVPECCVITHCLISTETYVAECAVTETGGGDPHRAPSGFIGQGYEVAFIDEAGQPCAPGEAGEICVRSRYVALGDWRDGRLDTSRFPTDPANPEKRIYRTGDIGRIGPDGLITVLGRRDRMLKINGQRVEPAEVEAAIRRQPEVLDSIALPWQPDEQPRLVAFVLPRAGAGTAQLAQHLHTVLRGALPRFLVPQRIEVRAEFPLLPGGKIDAQALLASLDISGTARPSAAPAIASATQASVLRVWRQVLGQGAETERNFSDAGGDSLQLLQMVFRLERALGITLPLEDFFLDGTIEDFSRIAEDARDAGSAPQATADTPVFLLPGLGGIGPRLAAFRAACAADINVEFLDWGSWRTYGAPGFNTDSLVQDLLERVRGKAPGGPISLAGYSIGAPVAHRLARALLSAGRDVAFLGLLDAATTLRPGRETGQRKPPGEAKLAERLRRPKDGRILAQGFARPIADFLAAPSGQRVLAVLRGSPAPPLPADLVFFLRRRLNRNLRERLLRAALRGPDFLAPLANVPTALFRADWRGTDQPADLGWSAFAANLTVIPVRGSHVSLFDPPQGHDLVRKFVVAVQHARARAS